MVLLKFLSQRCGYGVVSKELVRDGPSKKVISDFVIKNETEKLGNYAKIASDASGSPRKNPGSILDFLCPQNILKLQ